LRLKKTPAASRHDTVSCQPQAPFRVTFGYFFRLQLL
jgi:hypothetical protein